MASFKSWFTSSSSSTSKDNNSSNVNIVTTKQTSSEEKQAEELIRRAVLAEECDAELALRLYKEALEVWFEVMRVEIDEARKKSLSEFIDHYMKHAEILKTKINDRKNSNVNSKNYAQPTASSAKKIPISPRNLNQPRVTGNGRQPARQTQYQQKGRTPSQNQGNSSSSENEYEAQMKSEMLDTSPGVRWSDIAGLEYAKRTIHEAVVMPNMRPDLFSGLRSPPKGVLFYGPPGTGKTMLAKAAATESGFKFFSISSSSVTSKFLGEGEKLMKAVFDLARKNQPAVIFFDEIDALLSSRKENEHEASRRLKTEFMVQLDGAASSTSERILIIGATNIPWELDEAVLRRLVKRIYVPLPERDTRFQLISNLIQKHVSSGGGNCKLSNNSISKIVQLTEGYSASDLTALCKEAAMGPLREIPREKFASLKAENLRSITEADFMVALRNIRPSVSSDNLDRFKEWSSKFGSQS